MVINIDISKNTYVFHLLIYKRLVEAILKTNLPIDIWGNGTFLYKNYNDSRVKTDFPWSEINQMYESYKFHIAIENYRVPHYMTEKILNPFISRTVPIYSGCINILNYVNQENVVQLSSDYNLEYDMKILTEIASNPDQYYHPIEFNDPKFQDLFDFFGFIEKNFL